MSDARPSHSHDAPVKLTCLGRVPVFNQLGATETAELSRIIRPAHYQKGEIVQLAGDSHSRLLVLNRGRAKISRTTPAGREKILRIMTPGDFTGELAVFTGRAVASDIVALEPSSFCTIDGDSLTQLIATHPELALRFVGELSSRLEQTESHLESASLESADQKIATALLGYAAGRESFTLPISKKDLATHLGITPETLSRKLSTWQAGGAIKLSGQRQISIIKPAALEELAATS